MLGRKTTVSSMISDELIQLREKRWRKELPDTFKQFLKQNNGAIPEKQIKISNDLVIERFLCLVQNIKDTDDGFWDIDVVISKYDVYLAFSEDSVGADLIPFAQLNHDSYLCLCYRDQLPTVVIWDFSNSKPFNPSIKEYSKSFEEFLNLITKEKDN